jgi:hypothetical protein
MGKLGLTKLITARTWGSHHLPSYNIYFLRLSMGATSKWPFVPGLPSGSFGIPIIGILATLGAHNFMCKFQIAMKFTKKL